MEIASRPRCLGMRIIVVTRTGRASHPESADRVLSLSDLATAVPEADFVVLPPPLTEEDRGLVDEEFIALMKPSAILVNVSRSAVVDEGALYEALRTRRTAEAALDAWWDYPKDRGRSRQFPSVHFDFHSLDNAVLTPHRAAYSEQASSEQERFAVENVLRFLRGETPLDIMDIHKVLALAGLPRSRGNIHLSVITNRAAVIPIAVCNSERYK